MKTPSQGRSRARLSVSHDPRKIPKAPLTEPSLPPSAAPIRGPALKSDDGSTAVAAALALAQGTAGRTLIALRSKAPKDAGRGQTIRGRLERRLEDGHVVAVVHTEGGQRIQLSPKEVDGVADGGRITLYVGKKRRLSIDVETTDAVRSFLGKVVEERGRYRVIAYGDRAPFRSLPLEHGEPQMVGQTAVVHVKDALHRQQRVGLVEEIIPDTQLWKKVLTELAIEHGVEVTWGPKIEEESHQLRAAFDPERIAGRVDMTKMDWFSLDNPYSRDLDQAMAIERHPGEGDVFDIYYAIADLDYFLKLLEEILGRESAMEARADRIQTTTYLPGYDHPVLPRAVSEDMCSLNEGQKRPAFVIKFTVDNDGSVKRPEFIDAIIKNQKAGHYPEAQAHLDGERVQDKRYGQGIDLLKVVGEKLLEGAKKRGMIMSAGAEQWGSLDPETGELKTEHRGSLWIEEANAQISITANYLLGEYLKANGSPAFHRVHNEPEPRRVRRARHLLRKLGYRWAPHETAQEVMLRLDTTTPQGRSAHRILLMALPRAQVEADPGRHHGLRLEGTVQSTAPMRRTRDRYNHRWTRDVRDGRRPDGSKLESLVDAAQIAELRSRKLDAAVRNRLSANELSQQVGNKLSAEVVKISFRGISLRFPELGIEHFVPFKDFSEGSFDIVDGGFAARTRHLEVKTGASIETQVLGANPFEGRVELKIERTEATRRIQEPSKVVTTQALSAIRGDGFESSFVGEQVRTEGVVSAVNEVGFFLQPAGAEGAEAGGILVRSRKKKLDLQPGHLVTVTGKVRERRDPDDPEARSIVEMNGSKVQVTGFDETAVPEPSMVGGENGAVVPAERKKATEFWRERLGQRVRLGPSTAVSAMNRYGDVVFVPNDWWPKDALRTEEGGLIMPDGAWNHQSVGLKYRAHIGPRPTITVGSSLPEAEGVVIYRSGSFQLELTKPPSLQDSPPRPPPVTQLVGGPGNVTVAVVNALNLHAGEKKRGRLLGRRIAESLMGPDIIALQEIQNDYGADGQGHVDAAETYQMLIRAIKEAGGPVYRFFDIPPKDGQDGGEPGGNIRCGYLYRPDRVTVKEDSVERIGEGHASFDESRKSLAAVFEVEGEEMLLVNNHFSSRRGSSPWTSERDELIVGKEDKRHGQAQAVRAYVDQHLAQHQDRDALILGDFNDGPQSVTTETLVRSDFSNLIMKVPEVDRFDYNYRGTLGVLQPVVGSPGLEERTEVEIVHEAVFEGVKSSDHDPVVIRVKLRNQPDQ